MTTRTIEERAVALLSPVLAECVRQRTAAGLAKYGQRLDDNHQPEREREAAAACGALGVGGEETTC